MKLLFLFTLLIITTQIKAQNNPEVYLADIKFGENGFLISNLTNISNNPEYDNQPSFLPDDSGVLFTSQRGESTDIKLYDLKSKEYKWLTESEGGKYSPTVTPDGNHFSSIWLKPDGEQLLWKFPLNDGIPEVLVPDEVIGYHTWFDENTLYTFVLGDTFTFVEFKLGDQIRRKMIATNPGRSIHKIPGKDEISFIDKNDSTNWVVKFYSPKTTQIKSLASTPEGSEDMFWIDSESFLIGKGNQLMTWKEGHGLSNGTPVFEVGGVISRISLSPDRTKIAIVFTESE